MRIDDERLREFRRMASHALSSLHPPHLPQRVPGQQDGRQGQFRQGLIKKVRTHPDTTHLGFFSEEEPQ